jgi:hypothetical protein
MAVLEKKSIKLSKADIRRLNDCIDKRWPSLTARVINSRSNDKILLVMAESGFISNELKNQALSGVYMTENLITQDKIKHNI